MYFETGEVVKESLDFLIVLEESGFFCLKSVKDLALDELGICMASNPLSAHLLGQLKSRDQCFILGLVIGGLEIKSEGMLDNYTVGTFKYDLYSTPVCT